MSYIELDLLTPSPLTHKNYSFGSIEYNEYIKNNVLVIHKIEYNKRRVWPTSRRYGVLVSERKYCSVSIRLLQAGRLINFLDKFLNFANAGNLKQPPQFTNTPI